MDTKTANTVFRRPMNSVEITNSTGSKNRIYYFNTEGFGKKYIVLFFGDGLIVIKISENGGKILDCFSI